MHKFCMSEKQLTGKQPYTVNIDQYFVDTYQLSGHPCFKVNSYKRKE